MAHCCALEGKSMCVILWHRQESIMEGVSCEYIIIWACNFTLDVQCLTFSFIAASGILTLFTLEVAEV